MLKNPHSLKDKKKETKSIFTAFGYSRIMVDLILINEDACVFGNEIPIKCDVSRGAGEENKIRGK